MSKYTLTGPEGQSFQLTTPDHISHEEVESTLARTVASSDDLYSDPLFQSALASKGAEQRPERLDLIRDALIPSYLRDTESSPQADLALSNPNAKPGKIGPPSGSPTTAQMIGGLGADVITNALPAGKLAPLLAAGGVPWTKAELSTIARTFADEAAIAQLPGRSNNAVLKKMNQMGLRLQDHPNYVTNRNFDSNTENVSRTLELMSQNKTDVEIASELNVHPDTIRRFRWNDLNINKTKRILNDPDTIDRYRDMINRRLSQEQMAKELGKNVGTVSRQLAALSQGGHLDYTPEGGVRTPSLPSFKFMQERGNVFGDKDYERALNEYMGKHGYGIRAEAIEDDPFNP